MKKIIIIGHPDSHYQEVERIFQMHGMSPALPSKREKMTPIEIGDVLTKVQFKTYEQVQKSLLSQTNTNKPQKNRKNKSRIYSSHTLTKPSITNMWDALPMDLMLANLDQDFWGWADPQAIELLDYWANIDPSIYFVFIYDKPQNIFQHSSLEEALELDADKVQTKLESWKNYNQKVLEYFNKYQDRSVLISSQRIQETVLQSTSEIYKKIAVPEQIIDNLTKEQREIEDAQIENESILSKEQALSSLIVDNLMQDNQVTLSLYEELQKQANFPYISLLQPNKKTTQALKAWKEMIQQQIEINLQIEKNQQTLSDKEKIAELLNQQITALKSSQKELDNIQQKNNELQKQAKNSKNEVEQTQNKLSSLEDENKALMTQLSFTQEELERLFLDNKRLKEQPPLWGAGDRIRSQLTYRIGYKLQKYGKSPIGWIKMPFILYSTYRQFLNDKQKNELHKLPPIHLYQDAYEAEKVKKHLSYKLGQIFMKEIKNPVKWLFLPSKLIKEGRKFKANKKG